MICTSGKVDMMSILTFKILHWVWLSDGCDDFVKSIREKGNVDYNKMYIQNRDILSETLHHVSALIIKDIKETSGHNRKKGCKRPFEIPVLMILFLSFDGWVTKFVQRTLWNYPRNFQYFPNLGYKVCVFHYMTSHLM